MNRRQLLNATSAAIPILAVPTLAVARPAASRLTELAAVEAAFADLGRHAREMGFGERLTAQLEHARERAIADVRFRQSA